MSANLGFQVPGTAIQVGADIIPPDLKTIECRVSARLDSPDESPHQLFTTFVIGLRFGLVAHDKVNC